MANKIDWRVQAEMAGAGLDANQEKLVLAMVEDERERRGRELTVEEAVQVVRDGLVKVMDIEVGGLS